VVLAPLIRLKLLPTPNSAVLHIVWVK